MKHHGENDSVFKDKITNKVHSSKSLFRRYHSKGTRSLVQVNMICLKTCHLNHEDQFLDHWAKNQNDTAVSHKDKLVNKFEYI